MYTIDKDLFMSDKDEDYKIPYMSGYDMQNRHLVSFRERFLSLIDYLTKKPQSEFKNKTLLPALPESKLGLKMFSYAFN